MRKLALIIFILAVPVNAALVGHWKLNDGAVNAANSVLDSSGSGFDGDPSELTVPVASPTGLGFTFDGDEYITSADQLITQYPFTLAAWVRKPADSGGIFISISKATVDSTEDIRHTAGRAVVRTRSTTGGEIASTKPRVETAAEEALFPINQWHHVVGIWVSATERHLYINGTFFRSDATSVLLTDVPDIWTIGAKQTPTVNTYITGDLSDVRVYSHALTTLEVRSLHDSLLTYLKLDEPVGTSGAGSILDSSGNGFTGTPNAAITSVSAPLGRGITFNGSSDQIQSSAIVTSYPFSMSCWYNTAVGGNGVILFVSDVSEANRFLGLVHGTNGVQMQTKFAGGAIESDPKMTAAVLNEWVHIVGVWTDHDDRTLYVNGKLDNTSSDTSNKTTPFPTIGTIDKFTIGAKNASSALSVYFTGDISDARIHERVLIAGEVSSLYRGGTVSRRHRYDSKKNDGFARTRN